MPRTIPQIRERLLELADDFGCEELRELALETKRRSPKFPRARTRWPALSDEQKKAIRARKLAEPELGVRELGLIFETSIGRVSEALVGFRDDDVAGVLA